MIDIYIIVLDLDECFLFEAISIQESVKSLVFLKRCAVLVLIIDVFISRRAARDQRKHQGYREWTGEVFYHGLNLFLQRIGGLFCKGKVWLACEFPPDIEKLGRSRAWDLSSSFVTPDLVA